MYIYIYIYIYIYTIYGNKKKLYILSTVASMFQVILATDSDNLFRITFFIYILLFYNLLKILKESN
jgi:hypothetical protein